ncbi:PadR family transcriptional regulator [Dermacoccus nishinomiyaensis]|nr:PadR family transcriptional regulator [Dermacoccus nishinomiyaensis]
MWNSHRVTTTDPLDVAPLAVAVLSLLAERDMHPYEMIQTLRARREDQWVKLRPASLYHKVDGLVARGLAEVVGTEQDGNRPPRTTYRLTDAGRELLVAWISSAITVVENPYFSFSLALGELEALGPERAARLLTERVTALDEHIAQMRDSLEQGRNQSAERIWMLAHEHRLATLTTERDYIASVVHDIESKELTWPTSH